MFNRVKVPLTPGGLETGREIRLSCRARASSGVFHVPGAASCPTLGLAAQAVFLSSRTDRQWVVQYGQTAAIQAIKLEYYEEYVV
jgi:hypothetical protein